VRLVDCDIYVRRHPHPSAGGALTGALLAVLDDAGMVPMLDEHGGIARFAETEHEQLPVEALTALADSNLVRVGAWLKFDTGDVTFRMKFTGHHLLVLEHEDRTPDHRRSHEALEHREG